jgi:predicted nucleic acid-binding protein
MSGIKAAATTQDSKRPIPLAPADGRAPGALRLRREHGFDSRDAELMQTASPAGMEAGLTKDVQDGRVADALRREKPLQR